MASWFFKSKGECLQSSKTLQPPLKGEKKRHNHITLPFPHRQSFAAPWLFCFPYESCWGGFLNAAMYLVNAASRGKWLVSACRGRWHRGCLVTGDSSSEPPPPLQNHPPFPQTEAWMVCQLFEVGGGVVNNLFSSTQLTRLRRASSNTSRCPNNV